jgi:predicted ATPase/transcriptional regulator with XRE-family HTH domain
VSTSKKESVGQRLRRLRESQGWSQGDLADKIDSDIQNINRWENNKGLPQPHYRKKLADVFGLSIEELFTSQEDRATPQKPSDNNRPVIITDILGRENEIAHIIRLMQEGERCITLVGSGGVGKTRLALEITEIIEQSTYSDIPRSHRFIPLAAVTNPYNVPHTVVRHLDISSDGSPDSIISALPPEPLLLVIDNIDHVLQEQKSFFVKLLKASKKKPYIFLFTSRKSLNIRGEKRVFVDPLALPKHISLIQTVDDLKNYAATALFLECASERDTTNIFTTTDAHYIARLSMALDGLPLALEIAASRISKNNSPQALYKDMKAKGIMILQKENKYSGFDNRHKTLEKTIVWSYDLLSPAEKTLFCRLSLFPGGCTIDAVHSICKSEEEIPTDEETTGKLLEELVEASLLKQRGDGENLRYSMLQTISLFAQQQLQENPEEYAALRARFAEYYLKRIEVLNANASNALRYLVRGFRFIPVNEEIYTQDSDESLYESAHKIFTSENLLYIHELLNEDENLMDVWEYYKQINNTEALVRFHKSLDGLAIYD